MSRLRSTPESLSLALNVRTEGLGLRATGRVLGKSHATIIHWEQRLAAVEHAFTAISAERDVHANHNEAQNSALRRYASAYRRRQNLYAKNLAGLQRVLDVQRLVHNWVRPH